MDDPEAQAHRKRAWMRRHSLLSICRRGKRGVMMSDLTDAPLYAPHRTLNDAIAYTIDQLERSRPNCRTIIVDWGEATRPEEV